MQHLSPEMRSLLAALRKGPQSELPGLEVGALLRYRGHGWWSVEGARRCWQSTTVHALLRRHLLTRVAPTILRVADPTYTTDA